MENAKKVLGNDVVYYAKDSYDAVSSSDAICVLTEWQEFASLDFSKAKKLSNAKFVFDGRNVLDPEKVVRTGFEYVSIGRCAL